MTKEPLTTICPHCGDTITLSPEYDPEIARHLSRIEAIRYYRETLDVDEETAIKCANISHVIWVPDLIGWQS